MAHTFLCDDPVTDNLAARASLLLDGLRPASPVHRSQQGKPWRLVRGFCFVSGVVCCLGSGSRRVGFLGPTDLVLQLSQRKDVQKLQIAAPPFRCRGGHERGLQTEASKRLHVESRRAPAPGLYSFWISARWLSTAMATDDTQPPRQLFMPGNGGNSPST